MKKASEYRQHAEECRQLASAMVSGEQRDLLLDMANTWDRLATDRADSIQRRRALAIPGERQEEASGQG